MITQDELKMLCELSKLHLSDDEMKEYAKDMTDIINLMDTIGESDFEYNLIDTTNAVPFSELREDSVAEFKNMNGIIENGPQVVEKQFVVPKVVD